MRLHPGEAEMLTSLLDELDALLAAPPEDADEVLARLFPSAYPDDDRAAQEYRELTESTLRSERADRVGLCRADLLPALGGSAGEVDLGDPDAARRWIQVLNDLRLALGTRIGITADDEHAIDPEDPAQQPRLVYHWLTAVQDSVVTALMR